MIVLMLNKILETDIKELCSDQQRELIFQGWGMEGLDFYIKKIQT